MVQYTRSARLREYHSEGGRGASRKRYSRGVLSGEGKSGTIPNFVAIGILRSEYMDHIVIHGGTHSEWVVREYTVYFNQERLHQGIGQRIPHQYDLPKSKPTNGRITSKTILGGLHHSFSCATYLNYPHKIWPKHRIQG